jgi:hypothetical protein
VRNQPTLCTIEAEEDIITTTFVLDIDICSSPKGEVVFYPEPDELLNELFLITL